MVKRYSKSRINEALELLEEAAKDKKIELQDHVGDKYANIRELFAKNGSSRIHEAKQNLEEAKNHLLDQIHEGEKKLEDVVKRGRKVSAETIQQLEEDFEKNPLPYIGGIAAASVLAGFFLGRRKGDSL